MPKVTLPIPFGFYASQSLPFSAQRCINWIPTVAQAGALNNSALMQRSGLTEFANTGSGACRGSQDLNGTPYFVNGTSLYRIDSSGGHTNCGTITGTGRVAMANNGTYLVIVVPGGSAFVWDGETLETIDDSDYQKSDSVSFYRGYFVFTTTDGKQLFVSNLNQPLVFDALDFGSAEGDPDRIITQVLDHDELSILGSRTTETFTLVGGTGFPIQIISGAFTEKGAHSKFGVVKFDNTYLYIGGGVNEKSSIWRQTSSAQATKLSTDAIDHAIQQFTDDEIAASFAMTYSQNGQIFALFSFESDRIPSKTFVFNGTASALAGSNVWFEMQSGVKDDSWRVNSITKAYGKLLVGDNISGKIGYLDQESFTDYGDLMFRQATTSPFSQDGTTIFAGELEATFQSGMGLINGQGELPLVSMDFSDDGARTWSSDFPRSIGRIGKYDARSLWRRQGRFPVARTLRFTITDPVLANLLKLSATPESGYK